MPVTPPRFVIRPSSGWSSLQLEELWAFRDLVYHLIWRDLKVRYKQTALGAAWAVLQPVLTMAVFALFFGRLAKMPSDGAPYALFAFCGLVPWTFFSSAVTSAASSLLTNANMLRKVYFPRMILPLSSVGGTLVDLAISLGALLVFVAWFGHLPSWRIAFVPVFLAVALATAAAVGIWLAAINVQYRDVRYAMPFLIQFWMFSTPIAYPSSLIRNATLQIIFGLNPMTGVVEGMRWAILNTRPPGAMLAVSAATSFVALVSGAFYFRRVERGFADVV